MIWRQGMAAVWWRQDRLVVAALSVVKGARRDRRGVWSGLSTYDFKAFCRQMPVEVSDRNLGAALRAALRASRVNVAPPAAWKIGIGAEIPLVDAKLSEAFGLPDARRLYPGMKRCVAERILGDLVLSPQKYSPNGKIDVLDPPWDDRYETTWMNYRAPEEALGAAVRSSLARCARAP